MHPILYQFGPLTLRWYGFFIAIGFLTAFHLFRKRSARIGLEEKDASTLILLMFFSGVLGARAYYVILNWASEYRDNPKEILMIHHGGLVFFGGFMAACVTLVIWCRQKGKALLPIADALVPSLALGHAFGRLGCFMQGCCYGCETTVPWGVRFNEPLEIAGKLVHPTQIYESLGLFWLVIVLIIIEKISRYPGQTACTYLLLYSILRFCVEIFRGDLPHSYPGHLTFAQVLCIIFFFVAWFLSARLAYGAARERMRKAREALNQKL